MRFIFAALLLVLLNHCSAQSPVRRFLDLSGPEKRWVISHPFIARRALAISLEARYEAESIRASGMTDTFVHGGSLDAFRHCYWMARLASEIRPAAARRLGKCHEKGNYKSYRKGREEEKGILADSLSCVMDLLNNEAGIRIGQTRPRMPVNEVRQKVLEAIASGRLKMLLRDAQGQLCTCEGIAVSIPAGRPRAWHLPYCLVGTSPERFTN